MTYCVYPNDERVSIQGLELSKGGAFLFQCGIGKPRVTNKQFIDFLNTHRMHMLSQRACRVGMVSLDEDLQVDSDRVNVAIFPSVDVYNEIDNLLNIKQIVPCDAVSQGIICHEELIAFVDTHKERLLDSPDSLVAFRRLNNGLGIKRNDSEFSDYLLSTKPIFVVYTDQDYSQ